MVLLNFQHDAQSEVGLLNSFAQRYCWSNRGQGQGAPGGAPAIFHQAEAN